MILEIIIRGVALVMAGLVGLMAADAVTKAEDMLGGVLALALVLIAGILLLFGLGGVTL